MEWLSTAEEWIKVAFNSDWLTNVLLLGILVEISGRANGIGGLEVQTALGTAPAAQWLRHFTPRSTRSIHRGQ